MEESNVTSCATGVLGRRLERVSLQPFNISVTFANKGHKELKNGLNSSLQEDFLPKTKIK